MIIKNNAAVRQNLGTLFNLGAFGALADGQLLERFAGGHGEARELAFAVLVERHGPFVLQICRSILGNEHEADDAFQATFLALVRKAHSLWVQDSLAPWLHQVAYRAAVHERAARSRRRVHEHAAAQKSEWMTTAIRGDGLEAVIHEEINRLPAHYRVAVVLCDLEGRTLEQAARHIGCAVGTVKSRLARGRDRLRERLSARGLKPESRALSMFAAGLRGGTVPPALVEATVRCAMAGKGTAGLVPAAAGILAIFTQRRNVMIKTLLMTAVAAMFGAFSFFPDDAKPRPVAGVRLTFVDLQWLGTQKLSEPLGDLAGNDLAAVPQGPQKLGGTWYKIGERLIRVRGQSSVPVTRDVPGVRRMRALQSAQMELSLAEGQVESAKLNDAEGIVERNKKRKLRVQVEPAKKQGQSSQSQMATMMALMGLKAGQAQAEPPEAVRGIMIGARFDTLHILHSTMFGNAFGAEDGTEIGTYIVHYADRTTERIPIFYGKDVRDWWRSSDSAETSQARLAWSGKNAAAGEDDRVRLFSSEWTNPHPDVKVMAIDFETKNTACSPFLVALTLERAVHHER